MLLVRANVSLFNILNSESSVKSAAPSRVGLPVLAGTIHPSLQVKTLSSLSRVQKRVAEGMTLGSSTSILTVLS